MNTTAVADRPISANPGHLLSILMADHGRALLSYTESLLHDRHLAEDIVQETLIRAWHHSERLYSTKGSVRGWLLTVARNLVIDGKRSAASRHESIGAEYSEAALPDHVDAVLARVETAALLRKLSPEHQAVLNHIFLDDRTIQETAHILGIPAGTVKSRQHYALNRLRDRTRTSAVH
jgi:RNA polymerase sigma-70 factor (ECF subfamily)